MYTAGVVGGLSLTAACAPSGKYLNMSGPLTLGLGVVFVASLGKLSPTFAWRLRSKRYMVSGIAVTLLSHWQEGAQR